MKESKLLLRFCVTTAFVFCVFGLLGQSTGSLLADGAFVPELVSYSPGDAISSPTGSTVATKTIRMACYPAQVRCTKIRLLYRTLYVRCQGSLGLGVSAQIID